jgi:hypothetical protein
MILGAGGGEEKGRGNNTIKEMKCQQRILKKIQSLGFQGIIVGCYNIFYTSFSITVQPDIIRILENRRMNR